jgi:hypothetical protein
MDVHEGTIGHPFPVVHCTLQNSTQMYTDQCLANHGPPQCTGDMQIRLHSQ